jgi:hypothetical protein
MQQLKFVYRTHTLSEWIVGPAHDAASVLPAEQCVPRQTCRIDRCRRLVGLFCQRHSATQENLTLGNETKGSMMSQRAYFTYTTWQLSKLHSAAVNAMQLPWSPCSAKGRLHLKLHSRAHTSRRRDIPDLVSHALQPPVSCCFPSKHQQI